MYIGENIFGYDKRYREDETMIYITGDTHRDFKRIINFCEKMKTNISDIMVILGDVGINYYLDSSDYKLKKKLAKLPITLFCIHGNHEERPYHVTGYEEQQWHGGTVYIDPEFPNQIFAKDGEIYELGGKKVFVIGGAYSVDKYYRISMGWHWFPSEQPDGKIKKDVEMALEQVQWKVDMVFSHTCPYNYMPTHLFLPGIDQSKVDNSTELWLQEIEEKLDYEKWYFGHYHDYYKKDKMTMLFEDIVGL